MPKITTALLVLIILLLVVLIVDRARMPEQLGKVHDAVSKLKEDVDRNTQAVKRLSVAQPLATRAETSSTTKSGVTSVELAGQRDGKVRLGVNFLKPLDHGTFNPANVRGTLRYFDIPSPTLNYILDNNLATANAQELLNSGLVNQDPADPTSYVEGLATSLIIDEDYKRFTFTLRPGVRWQIPAIASQPGYTWLNQDVAMTGQDIKFYADLVSHLEVQCPALKGYYELLESVTTPDPQTLVVRWKEKIYTNISASFSLKPYPLHVYGRNADGTAIPPDQVPIVFNKHWFDQAKQFIGVGAYRLEKFEPSKTMSFVRNSDYWGNPLHFERIEWDGVTVQPDAQLVAFKNGQVNYWDTLPPAHFKSQIVDGGDPRWDRHAGRNGVFGWEKVIGLEGRAITSHIGWNMRRPQFKDRATRQALAHLFDKPRMIADAFYGLGRPMVGPASASHPAWNNQLPDFGFNPIRAQALLTQAGWSDSDGDGWLDREVEGKRVSFRFVVMYYGANPWWPKVLSIYRDQLKSHGIELTLFPVQPDEYDRRQDDKDFDALCGGWANPITEDYMQIWHSKFAQEPKSSNYVGFANPTVDRLSEALRHTFEPTARQKIAGEVQAILQEEQPYLFAFDRQYVFVWQNQRSGSADTRDVLDGVTIGFDRWHPWFNREKATWSFRN